MYYGSGTAPQNSEPMTSHALGELAGSRRTLLHMLERVGADVTAAILKV